MYEHNSLRSSASLHQSSELLESLHTRFDDPTPYSSNIFVSHLKFKQITNMNFSINWRCLWQSLALQTTNRTRDCLYLNIFEYIWIYLKIFEYIWIYLNIFVYIWIYLNIFGYIWIHFERWQNWIDWMQLNNQLKKTEQSMISSTSTSVLVY